MSPVCLVCLLTIINMTPLSSVMTTPVQTHSLQRTTSLEINSDIFETSGIYACCKMPSNTDTIGVQIESVTQIISHRLQGQGPPLQLTNTYERTAVLAASLLTHFTALLVCIKLHSAAQRGICIVLRLVSRVSRHFMADS